METGADRCYRVEQSKELRIMAERVDEVHVVYIGIRCYVKDRLFLLQMFSVSLFHYWWNKILNCIAQLGMMNNKMYCWCFCF